MIEIISSIHKIADTRKGVICLDSFQLIFKIQEETGTQGENLRYNIDHFLKERMTESLFKQNDIRTQFQEYMNG